LLFEVISMRHRQRSTMVSTNRPFQEWGEIFPNAACAVTLVDRLAHCAEVVKIVGDSYRLHEAEQRATQRAAERAARRRS
jgi:DNA replication protein DnaC